MRKIERLKKEAIESCQFRRHDMGRFVRVGFNKDAFQSKCRVCGMIVTVNENPPPNGIDIGGKAVALNCEVK